MLKFLAGARIITQLFINNSHLYLKPVLAKEIQLSTEPYPRKGAGPVMKNDGSSGYVMKTGFKKLCEGRIHALSLFALVLIPFLQVSSALAAATLMGVVRENQVGGNLVKNVSVSALGANKTITGADGQFVLHFPERQPGDDVSIDVSRNGWVVVNDIQLKRALPATASQSPLEILIAKKAERLTWALQFYRLQGEQVVEVQYKNRLGELEGRNAAGSEERARLLRERDEARAQADELARQIATRPAGSGNEDYQKAAGLFLEGRMEEALELLSEERLRQQAAQAKKLQVETVRNWLLRGQMLAVKFDFDGAARAYGEAVKFAPDSYDAWFAYSLFHYAQARYKEAREGYAKALALARASGRGEDVARTLNSMGILHWNEKHMANARQAYEEALKIRRTLAQKNPDVYLPDVAETLNNLGVLHSVENRMADARQAYEEALKIYRTLPQKNPDVYLPDVANVLNNLGILHRDEMLMTEARAAYEEALKIRRTLAEKNPDAYLPDVAMTLNNLGVLHSDEKRMAEARVAYEEALKICRTLTEKNPDPYLPIVAATLINLGNLHRDEKRLGEARAAYEEALKIHRVLAEKNPDVYLSEVAGALNHLGNLHRDENRLGEARQAFEEALKIRRTLAEKNPDVYLPKVANVLNNLGTLHRDENRMGDARQAFEEALKIYRAFAKVAPATYEPNVRLVQKNLDTLSSKMERKP